MMLDNGRVFFSRAWLLRRIRVLSDLRLNLLHLHFSDNQGFRVESQSHPESVTTTHYRSTSSPGSWRTRP